MSEDQSLILVQDQDQSLEIAHHNRARSQIQINYGERNGTNDKIVITIKITEKGSRTKDNKIDSSKIEMEEEADLEVDTIAEETETNKKDIITIEIVGIITIKSRITTETPTIPKEITVNSLRKMKIGR